MFNSYTIATFLEQVQTEIQDVTKRLKSESDKEKVKQLAKYLDSIVRVQNELIKLLQCDTMK